MTSIRLRMGPAFPLPQAPLWATLSRRAAVLPLILGVAGCGAAVPSTLAPAPAPSAAPPTPAATCGDGVIAGAEECDDANADNDDGCLADCFHPAHWVPSDPHTHGHGCFGSRGPDELQYVVSRQGLEVASALVWGDGYASDRAFFTGKDDPVSRPGHILHYDLEVSRFPAAWPGHLVLLGLDSIDFSDRPFETPKSGVPVVDWARAQGPRTVVGMAHGHHWPADGHLPEPGETCCAPLEFPVHAARGRITFLETERTGSGPVPDPGTFLLWKTLLNSGFPIALTGASDFPCLTRRVADDTPRTDVIVDGDVTYERWLDGIRRGRTAVVTGRHNHLNLRVNGALLGSEVQVAVGDTVAASVEADLQEPAVVELLVNGVTAAQLHVDAGKQVVTVPLVAASSFWVAARSPRATTSPIYVVAGRQPIRASAGDTCYLVRYMDHLIDMAQTGRVPLGESAPEALAAYQEARAELAKRFAQAGGVSCP